MRRNSNKGLIVVTEYFTKTKNGKVKIAIFLSGSGSNAEKLLEKQRQEGENCAYEISVLLADRTKNCRILELGEKYNTPTEVVNIKSFYESYGLKSISLALKEGQKVRELWTAELYSKLQKYTVDFAVLAGFIPLTNITEFLPCLNVHPGDLLVERNGRRLLVGLHETPIELAIVNGIDNLRSSVIIAEPYSSLDDMDNGALLGVSDKMPIDLQGHSVEELQEVYRKREERRPAGGYKDILHDIASHNQELLKIAGDHIVLPQTVENFAKSFYGKNENNDKLFFKNSDSAEFSEIKTVKYSKEEPYKLITK